jgi:hypothetical protein
MKRKILITLLYFSILSFTVSTISCNDEDEDYCFKCKDEFETQTFCYKDFKDDYTKEEFKDMVFNLEAFGFTCKRN